MTALTARPLLAALAAGLFFGLSEHRSHSLKLLSRLFAQLACAKAMRGVLAAAVALFIAAPFAQAQTFTQLAWGIGRGITASPICILNGPTCQGQIATLNWGTGNLGLTAFSLSIPNADQSLTVTPFAGSVPRTTSFSLKGLSSTTALGNFLESISMQCETQAHRVIGVNTGCVSSYLDMNAVAGGLQAWGQNINIAQQDGFFAGGGMGVIGSEINMNNFDHDNGNFDGDIGGIYPTSVGLAMTAIGGHTISAAISVSTDGQQEWNRGVAFSPGSITQCSICDYGSGAATVIDIRGAHSAYGMDFNQFSGGPVMRLPNANSIVGRNAANNANMQLIGTDSVNEVVIGFNAGPVVIYGGSSVTAGMTVTPTNVKINSFGTAGMVTNDASGNLATNTTLPSTFFPALTGDITTPGGSLVTTLATVNSNVGSFGSSTSIPSFTVNGKGLITAASGNVVIAPAGTLTGTTLASNVVTSSLTTVGTIGTGTWQGTIVAGQFGGTGVANTGKTITLGANLTTTGAGAATLAFPASPFTYTFPGASQTLASLAGTEALTNKDLTGAGNTFPTFNQNTTGSAAKWTTARNLAGNSVDGSANVAFANRFIVQGTTDAGLSGAQFLGALGTGLVKNTTTTGVLSIASAGTDYLTSVGLSFTGGLISVGSSPLTANGTLALTVAGTSGGIPYFSGTTSWASSGLLAANALMIGGGAGAAPSTTTTGAGALTALGINVGSPGAFVTNGGALGTPSSGTLTNATGLPTTGLTGTLQAAQEPAHTGDVTNTAGSLALTLATTQSAVHTWSALQTFSNGIAVTSSPLSKTTLDASGQTPITIANGANQALTTISAALAVIEDINTGHTAIVLLAGSPGVLIAQDAGGNWEVSTTPAGGNNGIAWSGSAYTVYNNVGTGTHSYKVVIINPN